jgi:hypothetical protein
MGAGAGAVTQRGSGSGGYCSNPDFMLPTETFYYFAIHSYNKLNSTESKEKEHQPFFQNFVS